MDGQLKGGFAPRVDKGGDICRYIGGEGRADLDAAKVPSQGRFGERRHHTRGRRGPGWQRSGRGERQDFVADVESIPEPVSRDTGRVTVGGGGDEVHGPSALPRQKG